MEKYTVVVGQKKSRFGWRRDRQVFYSDSYSRAVVLCNNLNTMVNRKETQRFIIISIDKV